MVAWPAWDSSCAISLPAPPDCLGLKWSSACESLAFCCGRHKTASGCMVLYRTRSLMVFLLPCRMVQEVVKQLGGLHIAINNAGINKNAAAEDTTEEDWDMTFDVNTKGVFLCCQVSNLQVVSCSCAACWALCAVRRTEQVLERLSGACFSGVSPCCQEVRHSLPDRSQTSYPHIGCNSR